MPITDSDDIEVLQCFNPLASGEGVQTELRALIDCALDEVSIP